MGWLLRWLFGATARFPRSAVAITEPPALPISPPVSAPAPSAPPVPTPPQEPAWLRVARGELQVAEVPGPMHNPRILEYLQAVEDLTPGLQARDETAWCSAFGCWAFEQCHIRSPRTALARKWLAWGVPLQVPILGCVAILARGASTWQGHQAFYVGPAGPVHFLGLGGNQHNEINISAQPLARVLGWRWPVGWPLGGG